MNVTFLKLLGILLIAAISSRAQVISTIAGNGISGSIGDNGPATAAEINIYQGFVSVDDAGNVYLADYGNNRVRKINPSGIITTIAGTGVAGYSGDGGPATAAQLNCPQSVTPDNAGNLYIADRSNHAIRKIDAAGNINTFAGILGSGGYTGDGVPATATRLNFPSRITFDKTGNAFIVDEKNQVIRKVNTSGIITTIAGSPGIQGFAGDGGPATAALFKYPYDLALDTAGNMYISDNLNARVRKINTSGMITTVAGNGSIGYSGDGGLATAAQLTYVYGIALTRSSDLYIADNANHRIRKVDASGTITTAIGTGTGGYAGDGGPATAALIDSVNGIVIDAFGDLYFSDHNIRIRKVSCIATPYVDTITATSAICPATTTAVSDDIAGGKWSSAVAGVAAIGTSGVVTGVSGGTTTISYTLTNSCGIAAVATTTLTVNPAPDAGVIAGADTICIGDSITLSESVPGGAWAALVGKAGITPHGTITGISSGTDTIIYSVTNSCGIANAEKIMIVNNCTLAGNQVSIPPSAITIFPNPAQNNITISSTEPITSIVITDLVGRIALAEKYLANNVVISVAHLQNAVYFVNVNGNGKYKLLKQ